MSRASKRRNQKIARELSNKRRRENRLKIQQNQTRAKVFEDNMERTQYPVIFAEVA